MPGTPCGPPASSLRFATLTPPCDDQKTKRTDEDTRAGRIAASRWHVSPAFVPYPTAGSHAPPLPCASPDGLREEDEDEDAVAARGPRAMGHGFARRGAGYLRVRRADRGAHCHLRVAGGARGEIPGARAGRAAHRALPARGARLRVRDARGRRAHAARARGRLGRPPPAACRAGARAPARLLRPLAPAALLTRDPVEPRLDLLLRQPPAAHHHPR